MGKGKKSKGSSSYSDSTYQKNKENRITKHLLKNPNDTVAEKALTNGKCWKSKKAN
jgi:hypothetical protein